MKMTTSKYEKEMCKILSCVIETGKLPDLQDEQIREYINACFESGYIRGIKPTITSTNKIHIDVSNPVVTHNGFLFLREVKDQKYKLNLCLSIVAIVISVLSLIFRL